jgi:tetratricopeptide (TPR) repeat protein
VTGLVAAKLDLMLSPSILRPPTFDAYRLFVDGHREMWSNNWQGALDLFLQAAARDSTFSHALYLAAINAVNLNQWKKVDSLVAMMSRRPKPLPPFERLQLDYLEARLRGDEGAALVTAREMAELAPGTGNHYLAAFHALRTNRPREAAKVLTSMDPDRGFLRGWFWYWYVRGQARHAIGDHRRELADAHSALARFPDLVFARALELRALAAQGKVSDILRRLNDAPAASGSAARDEGLLLEIAGFELRAHGHSRIGADLLQRAVASYELGLQKHPDDNTTRFSLARTLFALGRHDDALTLVRQMHAGDADNVEYLGLLGTIQAARGVDGEARESMAQLKASTDPYLFGQRSYWVATVAAWSGDLEGAVAALNHAFDDGLPFDHGMSVHGDVFLEPLRGHPAYERLVRARG